MVNRDLSVALFFVGCFAIFAAIYLHPTTKAALLTWMVAP